MPRANWPGSGTTASCAITPRLRNFHGRVDVVHPGADQSGEACDGIASTALRLRPHGGTSYECLLAMLGYWRMSPLVSYSRSQAKSKVDDS